MRQEEQRQDLHGQAVLIPGKSIRGVDTKTFEYDVFLSYSSEDKERVHALAERLKADGLRVWLDAWAVRPGDSIPLKIRQGLDRVSVILKSHIASGELICTLKGHESRINYFSFSPLGCILADWSR